MFSPGGGACAPPVLGTPCLEPCLIFCSCQTPWVTLPPWCLEVPAEPGWAVEGAVPSHWAGLYIC